MAKKSVENIAQEVTEELLRMIEIEAKVGASVVQSDDDFESEENGEESRDRTYVEVSIDGDDLGALIGFRGGNLRSIQYVVGLIVKQRYGRDEDVRVLLDVNDYREGRKQKIEDMVADYIEDLRHTEGEVELRPMKPADRRIIHMMIRDLDDISSESVGEGRDRRVKLVYNG